MNYNYMNKNISIIQRNTEIYLRDHMKKFGLGYGQIPFLMTLFKNEGISQEKLSCLLNIDKATSARSIQKLINAKFVIRKINPDDKRYYKLFLTDLAYDYKKNIIDLFQQWQEKILFNISEDEKIIFFSVLDKVAKSSCSVIKKEKSNGKKT